jgi:predicted amidohydrolase YtcJ
LLVCAFAAVANAEIADLVVLHGNILTLDPKRPKAGAFAVAAGKFTAIGTDEAVQHWIGPGTRVVDLAGKTVVPGFIDAHLLDLGIPIAGHSDSPVSAADPLLRIQDMVTRTSAEGKVYGAKQRITAEEALRSWTLGGAYASFEESHKGSIEPGKLADFVVLAADPIQVKPETIKDIAVEKTFIGGKAVFARE